jgi:hypothetical protein
MLDLKLRTIFLVFYKGGHITHYMLDTTKTKFPIPMSFPAHASKGPTQRTRDNRQAGVELQLHLRRQQQAGGCKYKLLVLRTMRCTVASMSGRRTTAHRTYPLPIMQPPLTRPVPRGGNRRQARRRAKSRRPGAKHTPTRANILVLYGLAPASGWSGQGLACRSP